MKQLETNNNNIKLMNDEPVKIAIIKLALPTMIAMGIQLIYNLTDTFFVGQTGNPDMVAAISVVTPLMLLLQAIGNIFAIGSSSYISRKLGEKNNLEAKRANSVTVYTAIGIALIMSVLALTFKDLILPNIGTSEATYKYTSDYFTIFVAFSIAVILQITLAGLIRSEGATKKAMIGMIIGIGLNIILDPIFILILKMGVSGAAWATVIGNGFGSTYLFLHFASKKSLLSIKFKDFKPSKKLYIEMFKIGIPAGISTFIMGISMILVNVIASNYGDYVVAGNGIHMRISSMCIMLVLGLAQGYQPFAGFNFGAKKFDRLISGFKITLLYSTILSCTFTAIFYIYSTDLISIFIDDVKTIEAGSKILKAFLWCLPFIGIQMTIMITFQSTGKSLKSMFLALGRQGIIYLPALFILNKLFGFNGFIYAQPIADILTTIMAVYMSILFAKELNVNHKNNNLIKQLNLNIVKANQEE